MKLDGEKKRGVEELSEMQSRMKGRRHLIN